MAWGSACAIIYGMTHDVDINGCRLTLVLGDITEQNADAIVNAANSTLLGGGGVDGAIHRAGGPAILRECKEIVSRIGRLPAGEAVITSGGNLRASYVIHTVGPVWHGGGRREPELLANAYLNSLKIATARRIETVAFPSISTGAYGYPVADAATIAVSTVAKYVAEHPLSEVRFVLFSNEDLETYQDAISRLA